MIPNGLLAYHSPPERGSMLEIASRNFPPSSQQCLDLLMPSDNDDDSTTRHGAIIGDSLATRIPGFRHGAANSGFKVRKAVTA